MDELKYEANGLKNDFNIDVIEWITTIHGEDMIRCGGDLFALFRMRRP